MSKLIVPIQVRSSYVTANDSCDNIWMPFLYPERKFEALHFLLGTGVHAAIEYAITSDCQNVDEATGFGLSEIEELAEEAGGWDQVFVTTSNRANRTLDTYKSDLRACVEGWMNRVPPWAATRDPRYDDLEWPPEVERMMDRPLVRTTADAVFKVKNPSGYFERAGSYYIVDWKSSSSKSARALQIQFYAFALRYEAWKQGEPIPDFAYGEKNEIGHFEYVALDSRASAGPYWGDATMARWWKKTHDNMRSVVARGPMLQAGWQCNWCHVRSVCPIYEGSWDDFHDRASRLKLNYPETSPEAGYFWHDFKSLDAVSKFGAATFQHERSP